MTLAGRRDGSHHRYLILTEPSGTRATIASPQTGGTDIITSSLKPLLEKIRELIRVLPAVASRLRSALGPS